MIQQGRLLLVAIASFAVPTSSYAYIDPGTGSLVLQMLFAGVLVAIVYIKLYWSKLKVFLTNSWRSARMLFRGRDRDNGHGDEQP